MPHLNEAKYRNNSIRGIACSKSVFGRNYFLAVSNQRKNAFALEDAFASSHDGKIFKGIYTFRISAKSPLSIRFSSGRFQFIKEREQDQAVAVTTELQNHKPVLVLF